MSEKRRDPRVEASKEIWLEGQEKMRLGRSRNLSKGGMFVVAEGETPSVGQELEIRFEDPEEGQIALKMEVVWRSSDPAGAGAGLGLRALSSAGKAAFERVVNRHIEAGDALIPEHPPAPAITERPSDSPEEG